MQQSINNKKQSGFTIVEIIISIFIISILAYLFYQAAFKETIDNTHEVVAVNFLGQKMPTALYSCYQSTRNLANCGRTQLIDHWGLARETSSGDGWNIVPGVHSVTVTYSFASISTPVPLMTRVVGELNRINIGSPATPTNATLTVGYRIR